jgi:DNA-binding SARP family transcriptional activator
MQNLKIRTLGQSDVIVDGIPARWRSESARTLFFYLLSHPNGKTRQEIIETLWETNSDAASGNRFRVVVYRLRAALGSCETVIQDHCHYRLNQDVLGASDAHQFQSAFARAEHASTTETRLTGYQHSLGFYKGDYLPQETADWARETRAEHRAMAVRAEIELSLLHRGRGDCQASVAALARALRRDPFIGENHHQKLMACLSVVESKYAAIEHYRRFLAFLHDELDDTPMPETMLLARRIKAGEEVCTHAVSRLEPPQPPPCLLTSIFRCDHVSVIA